MHVHMYVCTILETVMCFNDTSISINEDQGLVVFSIRFTNPSSSNITIPVITTDGTATGEIKIIVIMYEYQSLYWLFYISLATVSNY